VTPEARDYLDKARGDVDDARKIAAIGLATIAARSAYYAAFHAAEAYIVELSGKIAKTHSGVRSEFARLAKESPGVDKALPIFLAKGYKYKELSDYGVGGAATVSTAEAEEAIKSAALFIDCIATQLAKSG
jgi:uncharacterized protein (UPF0332 family)